MTSSTPPDLIAGESPAHSSAKRKRKQKEKEEVVLPAESRRAKVEPGPDAEQKPRLQCLMLLLQNLLLKKLSLRRTLSE